MSTCGKTLVESALASFLHGFFVRCRQINSHHRSNIPYSNDVKSRDKCNLQTGKWPSRAHSRISATP